MKSKLFKTILPAFALIIAISASLAFTPVENEDNIVTMAWYQNPDEDHCVLVYPVLCETNFTPYGFCSVTILISGSPSVKRVSGKSENYMCNITLFKCS